MSALERIVEYLASKELSILKPGEDILFALLTVYAKETGSEAIEQLVSEVKSNRVDVHGRARAELVAVARSLRIFIQSRGGRARIISDKELEEL